MRTEVDRSRKISRFPRNLFGHNRGLTPWEKRVVADTNKGDQSAVGKALAALRKIR